MIWSPIQIVPWSAFSKPATQRKVVVFPQPDGPRNVTIFPSGMVASIPATAVTSPNRLMSFSIFTSGMSSNPPLSLKHLTKSRF
jgi:hypothetical protein